MDLRGAKLSDANLTGANLEGADLEGADLEDAFLADATLTRANLKGVDFTKAYLEGANFDGADLSKTDFSDAVNSSGASFSGSNLSDANFSGVFLEETNFEGANLEGANFSRATLRRANLSRTNLTPSKGKGGLHPPANLTKAICYEANFEGANLSGAKLEGAYLEDANFTDANLEGADLDDADLTRANLTRAKLTNTRFRGVKSLEEASFRGADVQGATFWTNGRAGTEVARDFDEVKGEYDAKYELGPYDFIDNPRTISASKGTLMRSPRSARRNPDATFTVFHADHGVSPAQMDFIKGQLAQSAPQGFFIREIMIPRSLGTVRNALYGPAAGDAPVPESSVSYRPRGDRPWADRVVYWSTRPSDRVQAIGVREGDAFKLFTVYGGYLAPQHPDDPANPDVAAARRFWSQHALSLEQWDGPKVAKSNSPYPPHVALVHEAARKHGMYLKDSAGREWQGGLDFVVYGLPDAKDRVGSVRVTSNGLLFHGKLHPWGYREGGPRADYNAFFAHLAAEHGHARRNPRARHNPFFVSPKGTAVKVSDADFEARNLPRSIEREVEIEGFDPGNLPPGFSVQAQGGRFHVFFEGRDTGLFAMDPRKAAEIASRKQGLFSAGAAPKATAARPSAEQASNPLFGFGREELVKRSRAGDQAAAAELVRRGRDPLTGADNRGGLRSRFSKAVANPRRR
jgi:hypothetical protein